MNDRARAIESGSAATELIRQRAITERLLLAALHARDATSDALTASRRATFLASASRELAMSLDDADTREAIRRRTLLRDGSWCIVDIIELDGSVNRLAVTHPDPARQGLAQTFADRWFPLQTPSVGEPGPVVVIGGTETKYLAALHALGVGDMLAVPLVVRSAVLGAITFIIPEGDAPFSPDEIELASDLADLCALALDNERLYRQANELRDAADAANRAKSAFLGTMSHELMTPLNAIGGYVSILEMGIHGPVSAEQLIDLARIRHNQEHLFTLISEMLTFVRSEHGRLEYRLTEVSAQSALHDVADMLQGAADERQLVLVHQPDDADAFMWADPERVRQILLNLVMNAVKYASPAGGEIRLSTATLSNAVAIHVADNGPGIPADKLEAIFNPFVQLANGLSDRRGGVGLGLAISRDLARGMKGDLIVESTFGVGSRFTLVLPRATSDGGIYRG